MEIRLKEHQEEAVNGALAELATADRCKVIMACGTGKTFVAPSIADRLGANTVIIYLPSIALIRQTLLQWCRIPLRNMTYLCVCSDETVSKSDDVIAMTSAEIKAEVGDTAVTTDSEVVRQFLSGAYVGVKVVFSTYHSSDVVSLGCPSDFRFDIGFFDEAHNTSGKEGKHFGKPLQDSHTPIHKRVFLTATPKHATYSRDNQDVGLGLTLAYSMNNEHLYGREAYSLSIRNAIKRGIISDYRIIVSVVTDNQIPPALLKQKGVEAIAHAIAIRNTMNKYGVHKVITFHKTVRDADSFTNSDLVKDILQTELSHVSGRMSASVRQAQLEQFRDAGEGLVSNARCLTEGIDVPEIDLVAFLHPKGSKIDIIQAIGRALRKNRELQNKIGYILLPIYVEGGGKGEISKDRLEEALFNHNYDFIFDVVESLREQDELVDTAIRNATRNTANNQAVNLCEFMSIDGHALHLDILQKNISVMCVEALGSLWDRWLGMLKQYVAEHGPTYIPGDYITKDGTKLGKWATRVRSLHKTGKVSVERIDELTSHGFLFESRQQTAFGRNVEKLHSYINEHGNANVPQDYVVDGFALGQCVSNWRYAYRSGRISPDRIKILEDVGFRWEPSVDTNSRNIDLCRTYKALHGNLDVPYDYVLQDGTKLGAICSRMRQDRKNGKYTKEMIEALDAIGFKWSPSEDVFNNNFALLRAFKAEFGHVNVPAKYVTPEGVKLGTWVNVFRSMYKKGKLDAERIALFESVGFKWRVQDSLFSQNVTRLKTYKHEFGDVDVPRTYTTSDKCKLGNICSMFREQYRKGKMAQDRIAELEAIGFKWRLK